MKYCFPYRVRRTLANFGLPFEKATPLVHFPKALERPWNDIDYERNRVIDYEKNRVIDYGRNRAFDYQRSSVIVYERKRVIGYERNRVIDQERNTDFRCEVLFFLDDESHAIQI